LPMKSTIRAVIWDVGGVLIRTTDSAPRERIEKRFGFRPGGLDSVIWGSDESNRAILGEIPEFEVWDHVGRELKISEDEMPGFIDEFWSGDSLDKELLDFISRLHTDYKMGLLSNAWSGARQSLDVKYRMLEPFDELIFSAEVRLAKPDVRIYQLALDRLRVSAPETIFIDDNLANIEAANTLGIHGVLFETSEQARKTVEEILNSQA
jgi:epoxide hydrolase-like predicted phosphatase